MKIDAENLKAAVASYWRYERQCPLIAFEGTCKVTGELADVLAVTKSGQLIETEIKLSINDFRQDRQKSKHRHFSRGVHNLATAYFYFAVPKEIANRVGLLCGNLYPYAGVLGSYGALDGRDIYVYRAAKLLSSRKLTLLELGRIARDQSATLCRLAQKVAENNQRSESPEVR